MPPHLYPCAPETHLKAVGLLTQAGITVRDITTDPKPPRSREQEILIQRFLQKGGQEPINLLVLECGRGNVKIRIEFSRNHSGDTVFADHTKSDEDHPLREYDALIMLVLRTLGTVDPILWPPEEATT